jgi:uncharacterized repeat protein (TIGR03803 family)
MLSRLCQSFVFAGLIYAASSGGNARAASEEVVYSFSGSPDGTAPYAKLINVNGILFGTTEFGGANNNYGIVFKVTKAGVETVLHSFGADINGVDPLDGANPGAGLINVGGLLYGTTYYGGANQFGGTVFTITKTGTQTVIHSFGSGSDGARPSAALLNVGGTLFGTTTGGGAYGYGTVFSITPAGVETVVYSFGGNSADGKEPTAPLINVAGILYGTTYEGGAKNEGIVFKLTLAGTETVLHSFGSLGDGQRPTGGLVNIGQTLYGTTSQGGAHLGGTIFKITKKGVESVLHAFAGYAFDDGDYPYGDLINVGGILFGTTEQGGVGTDAGTVFKVTPTGIETLVYSFSKSDNNGIPNGYYPNAGLIHVNGAFYGTTHGGGAYGNYGTVFKVTP